MVGRVFVVRYGKGRVAASIVLGPVLRDITGGGFPESQRQTLHS
jgi:hypothetical protein